MRPTFQAKPKDGAGAGSGGGQGRLRGVADRPGPRVARDRLVTVSSHRAVLAATGCASSRRSIGWPASPPPGVP